MHVSVDLGSEFALTGLTFLPERGGTHYDRTPTEVTVSTSADGLSWSPAVTRALQQIFNEDSTIDVEFAAICSQHFKFFFPRGYNQDILTLGELQLQGGKPKGEAADQDGQGEVKARLLLFFPAVDSWPPPRRPRLLVPYASFSYA